MNEQIILRRPHAEIRGEHHGLGGLDHDADGPHLALEGGYIALFVFAIKPHVAEKHGIHVYAVS